MILDSESEFFNNCLENSPAVLDHSHVIWLDRWDEKTMEIIPELIFKKLFLKPYNKYKYLIFKHKLFMHIMRNHNLILYKVKNDSNGTKTEC